MNENDNGKRPVFGGGSITARGARTHNLKNIDVSIPRRKLVAFTGVSGSGKSSLAFDTIYAEGHRRYCETMSPYARQFLENMERPDVDLLEGLSPSIAVDQKGLPNSPRSTVGTITEIYDYLRLLYAAVGKPHCPDCGSPIAAISIERAAELALERLTGAKVLVLAPVVRGRKGIYKDLIEKIGRRYPRVRVDGTVYETDGKIPLARFKEHYIEIVVDRLTLGPASRERLENSLSVCSSEGDGTIVVHDLDEARDHTFSVKRTCPQCGAAAPEIQPRMFSFNTPAGACPACRGLGATMDFDPNLVVPDRRKSILDGGVAGLSSNPKTYDMKILEAVGKAFGFVLNAPLGSFDPKQWDVLMNGAPGRFEIRYRKPGRKTPKNEAVRWPGAMETLRTHYRDTDSDRVRETLGKLMSEVPCADCSGFRLKPLGLSVRVGGKHIGELARTPADALSAILDQIEFAEREEKIGRPLLDEVRKRILFLNEVGLGYLSLARPASTLSGGEYQRVRLAAQIGSSLAGVTYVLDEPSVGLHARDAGRLLDALTRLRDLGNTVLVVEHDEMTIRRADYIVDIGPGAGRLGGEVTAQGDLKTFLRSKKSLTAQYLRGEKKVALPRSHRKPGKERVVLKNARGHNLKGVDFRVPLNLFVCLTGVSGAGKSVLALDTLEPALHRALGQAGGAEPLPHDSVEGIEWLDRVQVIDSSPIGRTSRSCPATYSGVFDEIRKLFSMLPESKTRGYKTGRFSFNVKGGRCEACEGEGRKRVEMHFLPDVFVTCQTCGGLRYNRETLEAIFKGHSVADALNLTVRSALELFENVPKISKRLGILDEIGLGYLLLGQPAPTLSSGEAQRLKLAAELFAASRKRTLYLLDEPTTGLHFDDIQRLLDLINRLVVEGASVLVVEHNLDFIKCADWVVDMGPEGGEAGGRIVCEGTPEDVARKGNTHTGRVLREALRAGNRLAGQVPNRPKK